MDKPRKEITSYPIAMIDYFGKQSGQDTAGFLTELKALTNADKAEFKDMLRSAGYGIIPEA